MSQINNNRIAKNTLLLYFRMLVMMLLSLFTSRITLDVLGIVDYGVYNVVGGVVGMFSIISGAITVSISRYITIEIGKNDKEQQNRVFTTSVIIQMFISGLIILVAELVGVWFLNHKMVIPTDRLIAANWVLQCSVLTFVVGLISVPYNAVIIAHEKMSAFAYITILDVIFKLLLVYALYISPFDKLIIYAMLLAAWSIVMRIIYGVYCSRHFEETKFRWVLDKKLLKSMSGFIGWAFWGNGVVVLKDQGTNILLNLFCGPVVNAARGIAMQVNFAIYSFVSNFMMAVNPQITKSYAQTDYDGMNRLIMKSTKFSFFIMMLLLMPVCANINYILEFWLVEVPTHTANFIVLTLLYSIVDCYTQPLLTGVLACGDIKRYELILTMLYSVNFILSYIILRLGFEPESVFVISILFKVMVGFALSSQAKDKFSFPIQLFFKRTVVPTSLSFLIVYGLIHFLPLTNADSLMLFLIKSLLVFLLSLIVIYTLGITKGESAFLLNKIKTIIHI